jgi:hypothetical protein
LSHGAERALCYARSSPGGRRTHMDDETLHRFIFWLEKRLNRDGAEVSKSRNPAELSAAIAYLELSVREARDRFTELNR